MTYEEEQKSRRLPLPWIARILNPEKHPFLLKIVCLPLYPFRSWLRRAAGGRTGYLGKLLNSKKYREAYAFGESLFHKELSLKKVSAASGPLVKVRMEARRLEWWGTFSGMCDACWWLKDLSKLSDLENWLGRAPLTEGVEAEAVRAYNSLARLHWKNNDPDRVFELLEHALNIDPTHAEAMLLKAQAQLTWERGDAVDSFVKAVALNQDMRGDVLGWEGLKAHPEMRTEVERIASHGDGADLLT